MEYTINKHSRFVYTLGFMAISYMVMFGVVNCSGEMPSDDLFHLRQFIPDISCLGKLGLGSYEIMTRICGFIIYVTSQKVGKKS